MSKSTEMNNVTHYEVGGESRFSFDEVESIVSHKNQVIAEAETGGPWQQVEKLADSVEKLVKNVEKKDKVSAKVSADKSEKENAADYDSGKLEEVVASPEEQKNKEENETKIFKKITAKLGEIDQELSPDLLVKHKVDGQEIDIKLQELLNNYSGKQAWDKRFQQLDAEKKAYMAERQMIEQYITEFGNKVKNNDSIGAIEYLAQFAGVNQLEFRRMVRDSLTPQIQKFLEMDESQRKLFTQSEELDFLKKQRESESQRMVEEQSRRQLENQVVEFQKARSLSEEDLVKLHDDIRQSYDGEITLDIMANVLDAEARYVRADKVLSSVDSSLKEVDQNINLLVKVMKDNPEFSDEDLIDIVKETWSSPLKQASKAVSKKASQGKQEPKQNLPKPSSTAQSKMDKFLLQFDDL